MSVRSIAILLCIACSSCAILRFKTVRSTKTVWLSITGDNATLNKLTLINKGKATPTADMLSIDSGVRVYIEEWTTTRCRVRSFFIKVQIQDGAQKGREGWMCEDAITRRKVAAL